MKDFYFIAALLFVLVSCTEHAPIYFTPEPVQTEENTSKYRTPEEAVAIAVSAIKMIENDPTSRSQNNRAIGDIIAMSSENKLTRAPMGCYHVTHL